MKKIVVISCALVALVLGFYVVGRHPEASKQKVAIASPAVSEAFDAPSSAPAESASVSSAQALTAKPLPLRQRFEQARDLFALVQEQRAAADAGDPAAKTIVADAMYECIGVVLPPSSRHGGVFMAKQQHPELKGYIDGLLAVDQARCGRFTKADVGSLEAVVGQYASAAKAGSAKALAMQLMYGNLSAISDTELAGDVQKILASGDPDAIGALSNLMGLRAENRQSAFGAQSGSVIHQYAWQMAACRMGMNCGPGSALLRGYCLSGGICGATSIDQVISNYLTSPADYRAAVAESQQIVTSLSGTH